MNAGKQLQAYLGSSDSTGKLVEALAASGYNIGEHIGDNVYNAVGQAVGQGLVVGVAGSLAATAAGAKIGAALGSAIAPAIGTALGAIGGAVVGTVVSMVTDTVIKATGGKTATNLYLDDYIKQLNTGSVLTADMLAEAEEALVRALTEKEKADLEEQSRQMLTFQTMAGAKGGFWENGDINKVLYGSSNKTNDVELALRLATALEAFDTSKIGTFTGYNEYTGTSSKYVTVSDPDVLEQLEELLGVELELKELSGASNKVLYDATNNRYLEGTNANLEALGEAVKLLYTQGNSSSEITSEIQRLVDGNEALSEAVIASVGESTVMAAKALADYLPIYNEMTGSQLTMDYVDETMGLGAALIEQMTQMYDAITAEYLAQAEARKTDTWNRDIAAGDTSTTIWGANLAGVTQETLDELATFGIKLSEASTTIESELTGAIEQTYVTLQTSADTIKENLAGWQIDASNYAKLDFSQLTVTAEDAEILASAGIQINGDGTITFMKAENAGNTGTTRDLMLDATSFSDSVIAALQSRSIALDFEAKSLNFDTAALQENLTGAMFKLPDNFSAYTSEQVKEALENIGDIMDSGYFMITDQAVLNGNKTIQGYLDGMIGAENVNAKVATALGNIDALIHQEGATVAANIAEWADSIVMPSPIPKAQMTEEIEAAFAEVNTHFIEYAGQYMMVVENTGEHLYDGITKIDKEKWMSLDASLRTALEDFGVTVTDVGNQVLVDLSGTFNNGINDIVNLFIAQPDVWNQLPEAIRAYLEQSCIVSEEGWLVLKNIGEGKLTEIQGAWITLWDGISEETLNTQLETVDGTQTNLATLEAAVDDGLLKIAGVVDSSEIPELTENQKAVPFKNLPPEIQEALQGQEGLKGKLEGSNIILENATKSAFAGMREELCAAATSAEGTANEMATTIETAVVNAMTRIQQLSALSGELGHTGWGFWTEDNYLGSGQTVGGVTYYPEINSKGEIVKYWYFTPEGARKSTTTLPKKAEGGYAEGLTLTGELGREMAILPDGSIKMLGAKGRGELVNLPAGTRVLNNEDTEAVLKYAGPIKSIDKLADGNTTIKETSLAASIAGTAGVTTGILPADESQAVDLSKQATGSFDAIISSQLTAHKEALEVAIRGAVGAISEMQSSETQDLVNNIEELDKGLEEYLETQTDELTGSISSAADQVVSSLSSAIKSGAASAATQISAAIDAASNTIAAAVSSAVRSAAASNLPMLGSSAGSGGSSGSGSGTGSDNRYPANWYTNDGVTVDFAEVVKDTGSVSNAFKELGYVKNENGHWTKPKGSTRGSLVTKDALYRAGEFGLNEAIIPLERPDVLQEVGSAIGSEMTPVSFTYTALSDEGISQFTALLNSQITIHKEAMEVAIRGAVGALSEAQTTDSNKIIAQLTALQDNTEEALEDMRTLMADNTDSIISAIDSAADTVASAVSSIDLGFGSNLPTGIGSAGMVGGSGSGSGSSNRYPSNWYTDDGVTVDFAEVVKDTGSVSNAFKELGYVKNENGHWTKPKGSARGSLVTEDALYRAGELGLNEAIIPLERPDVLSKVGEAIGEEVPVAKQDNKPISTYVLFTDDALSQLGGVLNTYTTVHKEAMEVAIRGAVGALSENQTNDSTRIRELISESTNTITDELSSQTETIGDAADSLSGDITNAVDSNGSSITSAIERMSGTLSSAISAAAADITSAVNSIEINTGFGSNLPGGLGGGSSGGSSSKPGGVIGNIGSIIGGPIGGVIGGPIGSIVGGAIGGIVSGVVGGLTGKKNKKSNTKGSADGSLVTEDALYRAGELGLNEAIIPLERPDVLRKVGSSIAAFMPADSSRLQAVRGMRNAGVYAPAVQSPISQQQDAVLLADSLAQRVLETVLPQMAAMQSDEDTRRPVYVGTLIADEQGLRTLERRLYEIRLSESSRR